METYLTEEMFKSVIEEFEWPEPYVIEDDLPDGMILVFPKCTLYFDEGFEGRIRILFLPKDTGYRSNLSLGEALLVRFPLEERTGGPLTEGLIRDQRISPSAERTRNILHDQCLVLLTHFPEVTEGDFSWVDEWERL